MVSQIAKSPHLESAYTLLHNFPRLHPPGFNYVVVEVGSRCPPGFRIAAEAMGYPRLIPSVCIADDLPTEESQPQSILARASFLLRPLRQNKFTQALALAREHMNFETSRGATCLTRHMSHWNFRHKILVFRPSPHIRFHEPT